MWDHEEVQEFTSIAPKKLLLWEVQVRMGIEIRPESLRSISFESEVRQFSGNLNYLNILMEF